MSRNVCSKLVRTCLLLLFLCEPLAVAAALPEREISIGSELRRDINPPYEIVFDERSQYDAADIAHGAVQFRHANPSEFFGRYKGRLWIRLKLINSTDQTNFRWLVVRRSLQEHIDLYQVSIDGTMQVLRNGAGVAVEDRSVPARDVIFPIELRAGERRNVYLLISGRAVNYFDLSLWEPGHYLDDTQQTTALKYLVAGTNALLIVGCLLIGRARRSWGFASGALAFGLLSLYSFVRDGFAAGLVTDNGYLWQQHIMQVLLAGATTFQVLFARALLGIEHRAPRLARWLLGVTWLCALLMVLSLALFMPVVILGSVLLVAGGLTVITWRLATDTKHWAYLVWWSLFWGGMLVTVARGFGWLSMETMPGVYPTWIGMLLATLTLTYGLYRESADLQREAGEARARLDRQQQTERVRLKLAVRSGTRELRGALRQVVRAHEDRAEFLSMMAHELRAPLHVVLGQIELLTREADRATGHRLEAIRRNLARIGRLIEHALDHIRGQESAIQLDIVPTDFSRLIAQIEEDARLSFGRQRDRLVTEVIGQLPDTVLADPQKISQVLHNLLRNALIHADHGSIVLRVESTPRNAAPKAAFERTQSVWGIRLSVVDQGVAIAAEDRDLIFEPFKRLKGASAPPGQGLGLTISRQLVEAMGGKLEVAAGSERGSVFHFELNLVSVAGVIPTEQSIEPLAGQITAVPPAAIFAPLMPMLELGEVIEMRKQIEEMKGAHPEWHDYLESLLNSLRRMDLEEVAQRLDLANRQIEQADSGIQAQQ